MCARPVTKAGGANLNEPVCTHIHTTWWSHATIKRDKQLRSDDDNGINNSSNMP